LATSVLFYDLLLKEILSKQILLRHHLTSEDSNPLKQEVAEKLMRGKKKQLVANFDFKDL
jgi:hypothetical protein